MPHLIRVLALRGGGEVFVEQVDRTARLAAPHFACVEAISDAAAAVDRARSLAGPDGAVLVTGSLYLLADLYNPYDGPRT